VVPVLWEPLARKERGGSTPRCLGGPVASTEQGGEHVPTRNWNGDMQCPRGGWEFR